MQTCAPVRAAFPADEDLGWTYRAADRVATSGEVELPRAREFRMLGPLEVRLDGEPVGLGGQRRRALLARLLLDANRPVPADRLIEDLWGERARPTTANALQVAVSALRSALDPGREGVLTHAPGGYLLRVGPGELDAERFDDLVTDGRRLLGDGSPSGAEAAVERFDAALALHRGVPLADLAGEPCAQPEVERLVEARNAAAEDRVDALLAAGRHVEAVPELERLTREEPLRERRWAQLLLALYRAGRQSDALRAYQAVRATLAEELGVDPSPALRDLEQAILEQRPELDLRPAVPTSPRGRSAGGTGTGTGGGATDVVAGPAVVVRPARRHPAPLVATDEFIGREAELAAARAAWRRARGGDRVVLAVTGEPGAGKTRLCAEVSRAVAGAGAPVAYGRCDPDGGGHQPVARAVAHLVDGLGDDELRAALGGLAPDLAAVVPEVAARFPGLTPARPAEPQLQRLRVADAVARVVAAAGGDLPPLVVLDDLHWADGAAAGVLSHLGAAEDPLLLVVAYRDTDVDPASPVVGALADLRRRGLVDDIHLEGLGPEEVARCVQARAGRACTPSFAAAVHERTGGNPLLVEELTRALVSDAPVLDDDDVAAVGRVDVPVAVRDLVGQRLPALGEAVTAVVEVAAVVGSELDWEVLPPMTGLGEDEVVDALDHAVAAGLLVEVRGTAGRYAFAHDLVRQALHDGLGSARRAALHRRAASALSVLPTAGAAEVAHHLVRGATAATAHDAAMAAVVAAEDAVARVAHEEAARWYGDALAVLGTTAGDGQRALLLLGRGEALAAAGERDAAAAALRSAGDAARRAGDVVALARVALALSGPSLGLWLAYGADDVELLAMLDEAAGALGAEHDALRARVLACRASCRSVTDPAAAGRDAALALALADSTGSDLAVRSALFGTHLSSRRPGAASERLALTDRLLRLADEEDHPTDVLDALQLRLADLVELGRLHDADAVVERIEVLGERTRNVIAAWNVLRYRAMRAALAADFERAEALAARALDAGNLVQPDNAFGSYGGLLTMSRLLQGRAVGFTDSIAQVAAANPGVSSYRAFVPYYAAYEGQLDRAARALRENLDAGIPVDNNWLTSHTVLGVVAHRVADADAARELHDALARCSGLHAAAGSWVASLGPVDRSLALLAETLGDDDAADRHAAAAEAWCRQVGAWAYLAVVRFEHARRLLARGSAAAGPALAEARATAADAGVGLVLSELEGMGA